MGCDRGIRNLQLCCCIHLLLALPPGRAQDQAILQPNGKEEQEEYEEEA